ncbi:MAG: radical SAM protein [Candidatus Omnitrophica bacterium]|nr:radical SAM protein [Candidatus Omnitrophota bacterium]
MPEEKDPIVEEAIAHSKSSPETEQIRPEDVLIPPATAKVRVWESWIMERFMGFVARWYLRRPDQAGILAVKFPDFKSAFHGFMNELYFVLGRERGFKLVTINLEATNACNLACAMCPVNHGMERKKGLLDFDLYKKIVDEHPELEFILVFQWGEPMLHRRILEMIRYAHDRGIRTMMTTNGTFMSPQAIKRILESGLDRITFSVDGLGDTHTKIRGFEYEQLKRNILEFKKMRDATHSPLKIDTSMVVWEETERDVAGYRQEWGPIADRVQLIPKLEEHPREHKCRELWRGSAIVLWDGRVTVCCADSEGDLVIGNARETPVRDLWNGGKMRALRRSHRRKKFFSVCKDCGEYRSPEASPRFS